MDMQSKTQGLTQAAVVPQPSGAANPWQVEDDDERFVRAVD